MSITNHTITQGIAKDTYTEALDDFADLLHKKRHRLKELESNLDEKNFRQLKAAKQELDILGHIANYLVLMDEAIRNECTQAEKDWLKLCYERDYWKREAADNLELFKKTANSEWILMKIINKTIQPQTV